MGVLQYNLNKTLFIELYFEKFWLNVTEYISEEWTQEELLESYYNYYYTNTKQNKTKRKITSTDENVETLGHWHNGVGIVENSVEVLGKLNLQLSYGPAISLLGMHPK